MGVKVGCLFWGPRVVIPNQYRAKVLTELHLSHPGIVRMKGLACMHVWWPGIDSDRTDSSQQPSTVTLHPWPQATRAWERIHIDYAGPFMGSMFLVVVDAHTKWLEVIPMTTTSAEKTIEVLRTLFASYGLPQKLVSDNGPQFTASSFEEFLSANGVQHLKSPPYHPATNGEAERFVQTFKHS